MNKVLNKMAGWTTVLLGIALLTATSPRVAAAQDQDDPPSRVARLGYMEGSVSFQPAGESDWVQAVPNRPMTTGDKLWADRDSRAELQLGSAAIRLSANTGFSFLNLDDRAIQIQLTSGALNIRVRRLNRDDIFEIDTPNQAFSVFQPGRYRVEASEDGTYTVISIREGEGESTGNGQTYTLHAGQRGTFSGTESLNAEVDEIGGPDQFDNWAYGRDRRYDDSTSARYLSRDVVGYEDLDDNGDWRDDPNYGHVWFPHRVEAGWAPYREGHWDWISPWGWTWVDDSAWGYAPFHYGRWVTVGGRWGWVAGPVDVQPVYAPALVVFIGGGGGFGGNVGWFPLGPREVYVPSYSVSREYVNRVNISNTTVNTTTITNVYNTTVVNKTTTNITNVTYVNRNVAGAVTAVPQRAFVSAQPVARAAVAVNAREVASAPVSARAAVAPSRESVLGLHANSAGRVTAPPAAVASRQVIAKATPPPPPVAFAKQQQALAAHPGQPLERQEVQSLRPADTAAAHPMVKQAPPGKPATPSMGRSGSQPGNSQNAGRPVPSANATPANEPGNRPGNQPAPNERPGATNPAQPNRPPQPNQPAPANRPEPNRPEATAPAPNRPPAAQPNNRPQPNRPELTAPAPNRSLAAEPNQPVPSPSIAVHPRDLSPIARPAPPSTGNQKLDQKYQQQQEKQLAKQEQERQKLQQRQELDHQRLTQQKADEMRQQQLEQQHRQQTQQLEQKHTEQQQKLQDKQQPARQNQSKPPKEDRPSNGKALTVQQLTGKTEDGGMLYLGDGARATAHST